MYNNVELSTLKNASSFCIKAERDLGFIAKVKNAVISFGLFYKTTNNLVFSLKESDMGVSPGEMMRKMIDEGYTFVAASR